MVVLCRSPVSGAGVGQGVKEQTPLTGWPRDAGRRFPALRDAAV